MRGERGAAARSRSRSRALSGFGRRQEKEEEEEEWKRAQKVRASLPRRCSLHHGGWARARARARARGCGRRSGLAGGGELGERTGAPGELRRAPPREAERSLRANKGPPVSAPMRPRVPRAGALGDPEGGRWGRGGPTGPVPD